MLFHDLIDTLSIIIELVRSQYEVHNLSIFLFRTDCSQWIDGYIAVDLYHVVYAVADVVSSDPFVLRQCG